MNIRNVLKEEKSDKAKLKVGKSNSSNCKQVYLKINPYNNEMTTSFVQGEVVTSFVDYKHLKIALMKFETAQNNRLDQLVVVDSDVEYIIDILTNDHIIDILTNNQDVKICNVDYEQGSVSIHGGDINRDVRDIAERQSKLAATLGASKWVITINNVKYVINIIN